MTQTRESIACSPTPDIMTFVSPQRLEPLDAAGVERLKEATLEVLEKVGVAFPSERALEIFRKHGATVEGEVVRLPPALVEAALATAPRSFVLGGRESRFDLTLDGRVTYLATEGVAIFGWGASSGTTRLIVDLTSDGGGQMVGVGGPKAYIGKAGDDVPTASASGLGVGAISVKISKSYATVTVSSTATIEAAMQVHLDSLDDAAREAARALAAAISEALTKGVLPAAPIAARPATPAPTTSTLAGGTLPAAVT